MKIIPIEKRNYSHPELLAETDWLASHIADKNIRVIDARVSKQYDESHLPGAVHLSGFGGIPRSSTGDMATCEEFAQVASQLGITNDMTVVVYDAPSQMMGTVAWGFMYYGHKNVKILDGGFAKWTLEGKPTSTDVPEYPVSVFVANSTEELYCSLENAKSTVNDLTGIFWDTRSLAEYQGSLSVIDVPSPRQGRIPGAIHLEWKELFEQNTMTLKPGDELRDLLQTKGIVPESEINTYCQGGARASLATIVLKILGYEKARTYAGSYVQWAKQLDTTIETGD